MSITINGSGTITGISVGGLPDGSITNDDLAGSITDAKLSGTTCKAFVNFNGTGTVAIRAQFNVSSITDNGTGDYTVNFATAMVDTNYAAIVGADWSVTGQAVSFRVGDSGSDYNTTNFRIRVIHGSSTFFDPTIVPVAVFR